MPTRIESILHYGSALEILPAVETAKLRLFSVIDIVREWNESAVQRRCGKKYSLAREWYSNGGTWHRGDVKIETRFASATSGGQQTEVWALRYTHADDDQKNLGRMWQTDVGFSTDPKGFVRAVFSVGHHLRPGYLGGEIDPPQPSVPGVVVRLLRQKSLRVMSGKTPMTLAALTVGEREVGTLLKWLSDAERNVPIVISGLEFSTGESKLDLAGLGDRLKGAALVVRPKNLATERLIREKLTRPFRIEPGSVRIFLPRLHFESARDAKRHRYIEGHEIDSNGPDAISQQILRSVIRSTSYSARNRICLLEDVSSFQRESRIAELRALSEDKSKDDELKYTREILELSGAENKRMRADVEKLQFDLELEREAKSKLEDSAEQLKARIGGIEIELERKKGEVAELEAGRTGFSELARLPDNLLQQLDLIGKLHATNVVVHPGARDAAKAFSFKQLFDSWRCLWQVATVLHELHFGSQKVTDIERAFRERTGFDLSLRETSSTNKDRKLAGLRSLSYNGGNIDITPHVKCDKGGQYLRIHYCPDAKARKIVIGYCGDHMDTAGTRRR